ncbi:MAG: 50S ribosomal protein L10 [Candidatus Omnitrophica bacterium]|nr:50S ribosomal protein L10 [Candidatus Omnitrophota bacterium]
MKKVGLLYREKIIETVQNNYGRANGCVFVSFEKLKAFPFNTLRNSLSKLNAKIFVAKKSLIHRAFESVSKDGAPELFDDTRGVVFIYDEDVVKACKLLVDFAAENEGVIDVKGGYLKEDTLTKKDIQSLAKLPSREVLLGMAVSTIAAPLTGFVSSMNQVIVKFLWVINEIKKKKESNDT